MSYLSKLFSIIVVTTGLMIASSVSAESSRCDEIFSDLKKIGQKKIDALQYCLKEGKHFKAAYIYGSLNDCSNMEKYYRLDGSNTAMGNLGVAFLSGGMGCSKNIEKALGLLKEVIGQGKYGHAYNIAFHYKDTNSELEDYYLLEAAKCLGCSSKYQKDRALWAISRMGGKYENNSDYLTEYYFVTESVPVKCRLQDHILQWNFFTLYRKLEGLGKLNKFLSSLCDGNKEYFKGLQFENGYGELEDQREAYRLYLLAGKNRNSDLARKGRERIRKNLSNEKIQQATCLAGYGSSPNFWGKWRCSW